jgi:hypothetical protein
MRDSSWATTPARIPASTRRRSRHADYVDRLALNIEARGYRFISLEQALEDDAYRLPDTYVGDWGISWLHHWEITAGQKRAPSSDPPEWVMKAYQALR